jgi:hypothetical protein
MTDGGDRIRLTGEFADPALEAAYRRRHAPHDRLVGRVVVAAAAITVLALAPLDYLLLGPGPVLGVTWAVRGVFVALSAVAFVWLRGEPPPDAFARRLATWFALTVGLHAYLAAVWPAGHVELRTTAALAALMSYVMLPVPLRLQAVGAGLHSAVGMLAAGGPDPAAAVGVGCWLALVNGLGAVVGYRLHARQRLLFAALQRQSELAAGLGRALAEVRTLRGLIRVCAWCHKVDTGAAWQQLEAYVRAHSHAEFTHGICPGCLDAVNAGAAGGRG